MFADDLSEIYLVLTKIVINAFCMQLEGAFPHSSILTEKHLL